ncbi:MAG TPA: ATP-binding protein [Labilithrix sp.]|nr:ATP-binding protein [Labilithrix sp.]
MTADDLRRAFAFDFIDCLPLPAIVLDADEATVCRNSVFRARFGAGHVAVDLAVALRGGRTSAVRAVMRGASRLVPLGTIGHVTVDAHYFPIRNASGAPAFVGVLLVEGREPTVSSLPKDSTSESDHGRPRTVGGDVEKYLQFLLDGMPQLVWSTRRDGYHDFYNRRWYEYTGADPLRSRGAGWKESLHPADQERAWQRWTRSVETGEDYEIEYRFRRADGVYRWFLGRALPMRDETGKILRWFGTCTDVDDQKRLAQQRAEILAHAEATSRMKDEFLAIVSHELRTPLTAILGWARMQQARPELAPKAIAVIERNAEAQAKLIDEMLESSRIVTGKVRIHTRRAELNEIVQAAVDTIRPSAEAKGLVLDAPLAPRPISIFCDPDRLQQVVLNLVMNAVKFTPSGGRVRLRIEMMDEAHVQLVVTDTGDGIPSTFLPHVFEPFGQGEGATTRQHGGLGLGLAIVKQLVELHGGTVTAFSEGRGKGATFVLTLPLAGAQTSALAKPFPHREEDREAPDAPAKRLDGVRVLIVDDEVDARELVTMLLRDAGAETMEAGSVSSALAAIDRVLPSVLVSDIGMPGEDGYSLLRKIRQRAPEAGGLVPALALTAFARREDVQRAKDAGFALHLAKPVEPAELIAAVHRLALQSSEVHPCPSGARVGDVHRTLHTG